MAILTVRNVSAEVRRALRARASNHDHSTEAEVRQILARAVKPEVRVRLGDALATLGRKIGLKKTWRFLIRSATRSLPIR